MMSTLALRIYNRRKELGLTQEELAHKLGYSTKSTISKIEKGENDIPLSKVDAFAEALETTREYIMGWTYEIETSEPLLLKEKDVTYMSDLKAKVDTLSDDAKKELMNYASYLSSKS